MGVINVAALVILGFLLLRKLVSMERFFAARVAIITAILCGLLLYFFASLVIHDEPFCGPLPPGARDVCARYAF